MIKAVLLDFDGTIIDSQPVINRFFFSVLKRKGLTLTSKEEDSLGGISIDHILEWLKIEKKILFTPFEKKLYEIYFWLFKLNTIRPFPGAIKLLEQLKKDNIKMAIVTNSPCNYTTKLLKKNHLAHYFQAVVSVDDAGVAKPDPKMLGMAATKLHVSYKECIMIDDNEPGILAAKAIGMRSIHITKKKSKLADITLPKIEQSIKFIRQ